MAGKVKPIPEGYHTVTPYYTVANAAKLLEFVKQAFGAEETFRMADPDGSIRHAEARIGDSMVMIGQARDQWKPNPNAVYLYVPDVDATYRKALAAGARSTQEPTTHFYGDRGAGVEDAQGNIWWIGTHVEDVPPGEMEKRAKAAQAKA
ncbi:MAG TPA: VOC family protein [Vicinamibacteria bacterium]|jgi:PhnB protein|nr:VOC family protein [Vicinamibacteria bacterium]